MKKILLILFWLCPFVAQAQTSKHIAEYIKQQQKVCEVTPDSIFPTIRYLETMREHAKDSVAWALLSEILGRLYEDNVYLSQHDNYGRILEEWGRTQWRNAAQTCHDDARRPMTALHKARCKDWQPLIELVKVAHTTISGSRYFNSDVLHVLHAAKPTAQIVAFYEKRCQETTSIDAVVMARLLLLCNGGQPYVITSGGDNSVTPLDSLFDAVIENPRVNDEVRGNVYLARIERMMDEGRRYVACKDFLQRFPMLYSAASVRNILQSMTQPMINVSTETLIIPGEDMKLRVRYRNLNDFEISIGKEKYCFSARHPNDYEEVIDTIIIKAPVKHGRYELRAHYNQRISNEKLLLYVSPYRLLQIDHPQKHSHEVFVVDALTGQRTDVAVHEYDSLRSHWVRIKGDPQPPVRMYNNSGFDATRRQSTRINVYTDRAIYRPGQKVSIGALVYRQNGWDAHVVPDTVLRLKIFDSKDEQIYENKLRSDDFGAMADTFCLSNVARLGMYRIVLGNNTQWISVEEYKRSTYRVSLGDSLLTVNNNGTIRSVRIEASNFNGTPLRGACVTGRAVLRNYWWRSIDENVIQLDTLFTDGSGLVQAKITLPDICDDELRGKCLDVSVKVVAMSGEMHEEQHTYRLSNEERPATPVLQMPKDTIAWFHCLNDTIDQNTPASIEVGSAANNVHLYYKVYRNNAIIDEGVRVFSDSLITMNYTYDLLYDKENNNGKTADGLNVALCFVVEGKLYEQSFLLKRRMPDTRLRWHWTTFRDHVTPGTREKWSGRLTQADGLPADAHAMFTVYDASLDEFVKHSWHLGLIYDYRIPYARWQMLRTYNSNSFSMWSEMKPENAISLEYAHLRDDLFNFNVSAGNPLLYNKMRVRSLGAALAKTAPMMATESSVLNDGTTLESGEETSQNANGMSVPIVARSNFAETAFFAPSLRTDKNGNLTLDFILPDCMTTWNIMGVAHTRGMHTADIHASAIAQKDFMVTLDVPRFVRHSDKASFAVKVQNLRQTCQHVNLRVDADDKLLATYSFELNNDTTLFVPFDVSEKDDITLRAVAESENASDGEQRLVPVLSDEQWITRSMDFTLRGEGRYIFNVDSLYEKNAVEQRAKVSYTSSPILLALDVMKHLQVPEHNDAVSLYTAYYAASLTSDLARRFPDVSDYLHFQADSATFARQQLYQRLAALQNPDGGFAWFAGGISQTWITLEVSTALRRLQSMTGEQHEMLANACRYLNQWAERRVEDMKKYEEKHLGTAELQYLYVTDRPNAFMVNLLKKESWNKCTDRERLAIASAVLFSMGEDKLGAEVCQRMKHFIVSDEQKGAFFSYLRGSFTSIDRKLLTHIYAIEALNMNPDKSSASLIFEMRRYLLQQKRVQAWSNPLVNASAIHALLIDNGSLQNNLATVPGLSFDNDDVTLKDSVLSVSKKHAHESWGAVYVQNNVNIDNVRTFSNGLDLKVRFGESNQVTVYADRDYEYVRVHVSRPACFETDNVRSGWAYKSGLTFYHEAHDAADDFYIEKLPKGVYVLPVPGYVMRNGSYSVGISTIECLYAPEYCGNTLNIKIHN